MAAVTLSATLPLTAQVTCPATINEAQEIIVPGGCRHLEIQFIGAASAVVAGNFSFNYEGEDEGLLADNYWQVAASTSRVIDLPDLSDRLQKDVPFSIWVGHSVTASVVQILATK